MEPKNFCEALIKSIEVGRDISTILPYKKSNLPPYWVRSFESFSSAITMKIAEDYIVNNVPEKDRFPRLRSEFLNLYNSYFDEFSSDLLITVDGKKQMNDSWLRLESDNSNDDDQTITTGELYSGYSHNRGLSIVIKKKEPNSKKVDIEFPISELFEAAILIRKSGFKKPNYPLSVIYCLYKCILFVIPNRNSKMEEITADIFPRTIKEGSDLDKKLSNAKKYIAPLMKNNAAMMEGLMKKVTEGIDDIPDDEIDNIAKIAQEQVAGLEGKGGDLKSIFSNFLPGSDMDSELEKHGVSIDSIRDMVDREGSGAISNDALLASIPSLSDMFK